MTFFDRLGNGWKLAMLSLKVIRKNKQLLIFPIISGIALLAVSGLYIIMLLGAFGWDFEAVLAESSTLEYVSLFLFYLVTYFIIVFFNVGLIHCARLFFEGHDPKIQDGISFSLSRIGTIFSWAVMSATIGLILNALEEYLGKIGEIASALIGLAWSITTFFVIPVVAYENVSPFTAIKRSAQIMKQKWGESLGATFSFGLIQLIAILIIGLPLFFIGSMVHIVFGIALAALAGLFVYTVISAAEMVFLSAVYHHITDKPVPQFPAETLDGAFIHKQKSKLF